MTRIASALRRHPRWRRYTALIQEDMAATYVRDLHKWLLVAPLVGVATGLLITGVAEIILVRLWPPLLRLTLRHPMAIVPTLAFGFLVAGLIMQYFTPDPDEHSTEEIIRSYHEHEGRIGMRSFVPKLMAAVATVGCGGSAALEGPSIYGGGALGSWLWGALRRLGLEPRDRRIMLISGAAAGMSAVFRAPLTGIIFALEMPYKDDLAHEALMPSLIASVVSYATMAAFLGSQPLFDFPAAAAYSRRDLVWSAVLGAICGLIAMTFNITFRRARAYAVASPAPHWLKMTVGGVLTGLCGLLFVSIFRDQLIPLGPNYEAVGLILRSVHSSAELIAFGGLKLAATLCSLGVGGVSAMFVPLFLTGGALGTAFGQSVVGTATPQLFAAVGMAAFIAGSYKAPLTAVVFVAEATGGHAFIIPALIGAAVAYGVSGESSVSGDQRVHEAARVAELAAVTVTAVMQPPVAILDAAGAARAPHGPASDLPCVPPECDLQSASRLLLAHERPRMLLVVGDDGRVQGVVTPADVLAALDPRRPPAAPALTP